MWPFKPKWKARILNNIIAMQIIGATIGLAAGVVAIKTFIKYDKSGQQVEVVKETSLSKLYYKFSADQAKLGQMLHEIDKKNKLAEELQRKGLKRDSVLQYQLELKLLEDAKTEIMRLSDYPPKLEDEMKGAQARGEQNEYTLLVIKTFGSIEVWTNEAAIKLHDLGVSIEERKKAVLRTLNAGYV